MSVHRVSRFGGMALVVAVVVSILHGPLAHAYYFDFGTQTYFGGVTADRNGRTPAGDYVVPIDHGGRSPGYVMPNRQSTYAGSRGDTGQGGAIGTNALGYTGTDNTTRKQKLFAFLQRANQGGDAWEQMGSALVVHQMLGKQQTDGGWRDEARTITQTEWDELEKRLVNNANLTMELNPRYPVVGTSNTTGVIYRGTLDAIPVTITGVETYADGHKDPGYEYAWVFREHGVTRYVLEVNCANPIGDFGGFLSSQYSLTPTAATDKSVVEPGGTVTVTNTVTNEGQDPSGPTTWRLTEMVFSPGTTLSLDDKKARDNTLDPCASGRDAFPNTGRTSCRTSPGEDKTGVVFNPGGPEASKYTYSVPPDARVGTRICFTVSVTPPTQAAPNTWRHSALQCVIVAKKPTMQVWGGDVRVGGNINTSTSTIGGLTYGSWGEYGVLSGANGVLPPTGINIGFASGAGLNGGNANATQSGWSGLTFANTGSVGGCPFGCYGFTSSRNGLTNQFGTGNDRPASDDLNAWPNGTYAVNGLTLNGITLHQGKSLVIRSTGIVTIAGDIAYDDGPYTSIKDLPQLVIRAPEIRIQGNVKQVDAWLLAITSDTKGILNTCIDRVAPDDDRLTADICNTPLKVNGPVVADRILLRRTAGSDGTAATRGDPAEVFNLRADAYLWGSNYSNGQNRVRTVYTKELPPRY